MSAERITRVSKSIAPMVSVNAKKTTYEPRNEKTVFAYAKTKTQISFAVTAKLISAFVFATRIVQSLFFLNPKFQASSHLLWLYRQVCVGPGRKPQRPVFSQRGSYLTDGTQDERHCVPFAKEMRFIVWRTNDHFVTIATLNGIV